MVFFFRVGLVILQMKIDCLRNFHNTPPPVGVIGVSAIFNYTPSTGDRRRKLPSSDSGMIFNLPLLKSMKVYKTHFKQNSELPDQGFEK